MEGRKGGREKGRRKRKYEEEEEEDEFEESYEFEYRDVVKKRKDEVSVLEEGKKKKLLICMVCGESGGSMMLSKHQEMIDWYKEMGVQRLSIRDNICKYCYYRWYNCCVRKSSRKLRREEESEEEKKGVVIPPPLIIKGKENGNGHGKEEELKGEVMEKCRQLVVFLRCHTSGKPFNHSIAGEDRVLLDSLVEDEEDLRTVKECLLKGEFHSLEQFASKVRSVFSNLKAFQDSQNLEKMAGEMLRIFEENFKKLVAGEKFDFSIPQITEDDGEEDETEVEVEVIEAVKASMEALGDRGTMDEIMLWVQNHLPKLRKLNDQEILKTLCDPINSYALAKGRLGLGSNPVWCLLH